MLTEPEREGLYDRVAEWCVAWSVGHVWPDDWTGARRFVAAYEATGDGCFADARPLGALRFKALARIPG